VPASRVGGETFAEIDPAEKHSISHRADAFAKLVADQFVG
jgi:XTP/dITP diphosphohydrolase